MNSVLGAGRYAPSPTGELHLGNLRTALLAWAFARKAGRQFYLRMEDLDQRSRLEYETQQLKDLEAFGIDWDGEVVRQSARSTFYADILRDLREKDLLYECYCTRKDLRDEISAPHFPPGAYGGRCRHLNSQQREERADKLQNRVASLRLKTTGEEISFTDWLHGEYSGRVDDFVLWRGDGFYSYNFASVVDDMDMGIAQIVRGDDLISSVPRQIYLQRVLGAVTPEYVHVPLVLNQKGQRLAKRDGAVTLSQLNAQGITVGDVVELLSVSLGFAPVSSPMEFLAEFNVNKINVKPWTFIT